MKKIISLLIILTMILTIIPCGAQGLSAQELGISIENNISIEGDTESGFTVKISKGHPKIPKIICENASEIYDGFIPMYETVGYGKVVIGTEEYKIKFEKALDEFVLQYDDRYTHDFELDGNLTYTSSDNSIISVDSSGVMTANKVSDFPVTITATSAYGTRTLVVSKVIKAPLNVFLITGQSNAYGADTVKEDAPLVDYGTVYSYTFDKYYTKPASQSPDLSRFDCEFNSFNPSTHNSVQSSNSSYGYYGFPPQLGKTWFDKTGEKILFIMVARGSTSSEQWQPDYVLKESDRSPNFYPENATGEEDVNNTIPKWNLYTNACIRYSDAMEDFNKGSSATSNVNSDNFEINRKGYFWYQGENDIQASVTKDVYYENLLNIHDGFTGKKDYNLYTEERGTFSGKLDLNFGATIVPRYCNNPKDNSDLIDGTRAAQYQLHQDLDDFYIACNEPEVMPTSEMEINSWNMIHHSQKSYNEIGELSAITMINNFSATTDRSVKDVKIYYDCTLFKQNEKELTVLDSDKHLVLFVAEPLYAKTPKVEITEVTGNSIKLGVDSATGVENISFKKTDSPVDAISVKAGDFTKTFNFKNSFTKECPSVSLYTGNKTISIGGYLGNGYPEDRMITVFYIPKDKALKETSDDEIIHTGLFAVDTNKKYSYAFEIDESVNTDDYKIVLKQGENDITDTLTVNTIKSDSLFDVSLDFERVSNSVYYQKQNTSSDTFGNAVIKIRNPYKAEADMTLILASYDRNGRLIDMKSASITSPKQEEFTQKFAVSGNARTVKAFIWHTSGIKMLSNFAELRR